MEMQEEKNHIPDQHDHGGHHHTNQMHHMDMEVTHDQMTHATEEMHGEMDHAMMHMGNLKQKFFISLILAIPILLLSPMMGIDLPFSFQFNGSDWLVLGLATLLYFYGGMPFLSGAKMELSMKNPAMMTLIALGISVSYFYSLYAFIQNNLLAHSEHVMDFFWELASLIVIMLLGHWIEMHAVAKAGNAVQKIAELLPNEAKIIDDKGNLSSVALTEVTKGQKVLVSAGDKIPTDGIIISGETTITIMLTGDNKSAAKRVADLLGIDTFKAALKPEDKEAVIRQYQEQGKPVMMVGDGINDAPSLVRADIGIAIGAGTDIAVDAADVVLVKSNPNDSVQFLKLARHTTSKMKQNLWWGAGYNLVAIPLAAGILAFAGIVLSPAFGAVLMSLSTVIVAINALLLRIR